MEAGEGMDVDKIPIPTGATIKVSKEGKAAVFDTTVVQTTDNKYVYVMPVKYDNKIVNFAGKGMYKELKVQFESGKVYVWKNIAMAKFFEDGRQYLRIRTTVPGVELIRHDKESSKEQQHIMPPVI